MAAPILANPQVAAAGISALGSIGSSFLGNIIGQKNMNSQVEASKELMKYQWDKFQSPKAQVSALTAAGINPAVALGQGGSGFTATPQASMPTAPNYVPPSIGDISSFVLAMANAKKLEADAKKAGVETQNIEVDTQAKQFELELSKVFAVPEKTAALTTAWKNVMLSDDQHSINEWIKAKEKALSEAEGIKKDILQKNLDNMDIQIEQENRKREEDIRLVKQQQKTEGTKQIANRASANASNASAMASRSQSHLTDAQKDYQDIINGVERATSHAKRMNLLKRLETSNVLSEEEQKKARIMINRYDWLIKEKNMTKAQDYFDYMMWYWKNETPDIDFDVPLAIPIK